MSAARRNWHVSKEFICHLIIIVTESGNRWSGFFYYVSLLRRARHIKVHHLTRNLYPFENSNRNVPYSSPVPKIHLSSLLLCIKGEMDDFSMLWGFCVCVFYFLKFLNFFYNQIFLTLSILNHGISRREFVSLWFWFATKQYLNLTSWFGRNDGLQQKFYL